MGRLKELKDKQAAGELSDAELKELNELEADVKDLSADKQEEKDVEAEVEKLSDSLAKSFMDKISPLTELADKLKEVPAPKAEVTQESKFIVDPELGKVPVAKLDEVKVEVPGRKAEGKKFTEVSKKTIHYLQALVTGDRQKLQTLVEGTGASGGFLVPEDFVNILIEDRRDQTVMRQLATVLQVSTDTVHIPTLGSRPKAFWRSEAAVKATTTVGFGEVVLTPYSLAAIVPLSNELVADASLGGSIVSIVSRVMSRALAEEEDRAFWEGSGSGQPTGVDNYSYTTLTAAATDSSRADTIIQALYRLDQGYRGSAVFVANKNTWAKVATLKDGMNNYLLSGLGDAAQPTLRGRPTYEQNDIPDGKMFLGDFSYYYIADRQGVTVDTSTEATVASQSAFERNLTFVRAEERVDGEMTITDPVIEIAGLGGL